DGDGSLAEAHTSAVAAREKAARTRAHASLKGRTNLGWRGTSLMLDSVTKRLLHCITTAMFGIVVELPAGASSLQLQAPRIFEESVSHELRLSEEGAIELAVGELFEDD